MAEVTHTAEIVSLPVAATGRVEQVNCTWTGLHNDGNPWQYRDYADPYAPMLICDVHGEPAQWQVYETGGEDDSFTGPCQWFEERDTRPTPPGKPATDERTPR
jgi:hypothetical protein